MHLNSDINIYTIQGHSEKVRKAYIICLVLIGAGVLLLLIQLRLHASKNEAIDDVVVDSSEMLSPQYKGVTEDGQDFLITSQKAKELEDGVVLLSSPVANLFEDSDLASFVLDSVSGVYDDNEKILTLVDNVELDDNDGNSFKASEVKVDLEKNVIYSDNKIDLSGKIGRITADGLEIQDEGNMIIFKGKSKMIINDTTKVNKWQGK